MAKNHPLGHAQRAMLKRAVEHPLRPFWWSGSGWSWFGEDAKDRRLMMSLVKRGLMEKRAGDFSEEEFHPTDAGRKAVEEMTDVQA